MHNGRDCAHGRQVGKCDTCDLIDAEQRILELEAEVEQLETMKLQWYRRGFERCIDEIIEMGVLCESGTIVNQLRKQAKGE